MDEREAAGESGRAGFAGRRRIKPGRSAGDAFPGEEVTFLYFARVPFVLVFLLFVLALVVFNWRVKKDV